ncbi:MAG: hypothetical protein A2020_14080 [Lentisphaerae bacterium GWF2_45_14]|nr:MAG: hypothetical protein A2020_14080 [Lentisphaerae bacterium GWF2_45_14]
MPLVKVETSVSCDAALKEKIIKALSRICAEETGKPERYVAVVFENDAMISFGGELCSGAWVEVRGIGGLDGKVNQKISHAVCTLLNKELGIATSNIYINFTNVAASDWGCNGTTFG